MDRTTHWKADYLYRLERSRTREDLFVVAAEAARKLGFTHCCYGAGLPQPDRLSEAVILQTYPSGWIQHYVRERFIEIDPTVLHGQRTGTLQVWSDGLFANAPRLWSDARDFGLRVGVAQSAWAAGGSYGLLSLSRDAEPLTSAELDATGFAIAWIAQTLHVAMVEKGRVVPMSRPELTAREMEILRWLAAGKTADAISERLIISTRTVNFHVGNVLSKLGATNKVQAIVTALASGLISI